MAAKLSDVEITQGLMGADEEGTLSTLKLHRQAVFDPAVAAHNGRIVKLLPDCYFQAKSAGSPVRSAIARGDGTIVEFASVVDAVNCTLSVQRADSALPNEALRQIGIRTRRHRYHTRRRKAAAERGHRLDRRTPAKSV
jgi:class 3 adenylate cyclase